MTKRNPLSNINAEALYKWLADHEGKSLSKIDQDRQYHIKLELIRRGA